MTQGLKLGLLSVFVNKDLLEPIHNYFLCNVYGVFVSQVQSRIVATETIWPDVLVRSPETQDQLADAVMEAKKSHSPLSANWRIMYVGGII